MAGYEKLAAEIQSLSERTATSRPIAAKAVDKLAIGRDFKASNITVTQPISEGADLIRHQPPDGDNYRISQDLSDNSMQVVNDSTGLTSAYFYPNGRAFIDPLDDSIHSNHISSLAGSRIQSGTMPGTRLQNNTLAFAQYGDAEMGDQKIYNFGVNYSHMSGDTKNQSTGTSSMRSLGTGSTTSAAGSNHTHLSVNFNSQYTIDQKEIAANLVSTVRDMVMQPALAPLRDLVLELAHQLMDEPDLTVQEKVNRLKADPVYAHEFRMKHDPEYYAAWCIDQVPEYADKMENDLAVQEMAAHARQVYARIEDDPAIVEDYKNRRGPFS